MRLGSDERAPVEIIPTGSIALDVALGVGGLPRGRIIEIYGPESSGKTTLTLHAIANVQKAGGIAAFIDAEHALDPDYAQKLGVDIDQLLVSQPDTGEQALEIVEHNEANNTDFDIPGTPSFAVNGVLLQGVHTWGALQPMLDNPSVAESGVESTAQ